MSEARPRIEPWGSIRNSTARPRVERAAGISVSPLSVVFPDLVRCLSGHGLAPPGLWGYQMRRAAAHRLSSWRLDSWSLRRTAEA